MIIQFFLGCFIVTSIVYQLVYCPKNKIINIIYQSNQWFLEDSVGNHYHAELLSDSFVSTPFIILRFKFFTKERKSIQSFILVSDVIDRDLLRQIRVVLYAQ